MSQSELHRGPLTDFVSAAGLRWLVLVKPQEISADPELGPALRALVPTRRLEAFAESSGVDLRAVPHALVAGFSYSTLYLAELPDHAAEPARVRFSERLIGGPRIQRPRPELVRISGVIGRTPETLLTIDDRVLAIAVGDPVPAKIAERYAEQRLKNSPVVLRGAALSTLPSLSESHAAVLLAPGPFADEWQAAAGGLLRSTTALAIAIAAEPSRARKLATTIYLSGDWQTSGAEATKRLRAAWTTLATSSAGHLFGLSDVAEVSVTRDLLTLRVELDITALVRGLRASILGDLSEILNLTPPGTATRAAPTEPVPNE